MPVNGPISYNFPFFLRYKPEAVMVDCVSDPTFVVLHHDYLKNGYERLTHFVDKLNTRSNNIRWDSAGNIIRHYISISQDHPDDPIDVDLSGLQFHGHKENFKISMRRYSSEFRDNYLCKSDFLFNSVKKVKALMSIGSRF
jgi:hypothetical protein